VNFVLSFGKEEGVSQEQGRAIAKEFMKSFMHGFNDDEYHLDIVEHTDTDHLHYHARIPKINLLTNTQLKLYWHKTDLSYKKAVIDDICHRHGLVTGAEMKRAIPNPMEKLERVAKWREEHGQKALDLSSPKLKRETEKKVSDYIAEGVKAGLFNTLNDVENELGILGVNIVNKGYDKGKQFHYLTIENESGKMRVKGDIYSAEFYQLTREDRSKSVSSNKSFTTRDAELRASGTDVKQALQRERNKRLKFVEQQYGRARERAAKEQDSRSVEVDNRRDTRSVAKDTHANPKIADTNAKGRGATPKRDESYSQGSTRGVEEDFKESKEPMDHENTPHSNRGRSDVRRGGIHTRVLYGKTPNEQAKRREFFEEALQDNSNRRRLQIDIEGEEIDDSTRREISKTTRSATEDIRRGVERDRLSLQAEYERSQSRDSEAERDVEALRGRVHELANKHQSRTAGAIGERTERAYGEVTGAFGEYEFGQSQVKRKVGEFEQRKSALRDGANELQEQVGELDDNRRGVIEKARELLEKVVEKVRELAKRVNHDSSFMMMR